jgi:hypothetical protein
MIIPLPSLKARIKQDLKLHAIHDAQKCVPAFNPITKPCRELLVFVSCHVPHRKVCGWIIKSIKRLIQFLMRLASLHMTERAYSSQGHMHPYSIMPAHIPNQGFKVRSSKQIEEYTIKLNPDPVSEGGSHKIVYSGKKKHTSFILRLWF